MLQIYGKSSGGVGVGGAPGAPTSNDTSAVHAISPSSLPPPSSLPSSPSSSVGRRGGRTPRAPRRAALVEVPADDEREELLVALGRGPPDGLGERGGQEADERLGHGVVFGAAGEGAHGEEAVREGVLVAEGRELVELRERARRQEDAGAGAAPRGGGGGGRGEAEVARRGATGEVEVRVPGDGGS